MSYFPIIIEYDDGRIVIVQSPSSIERGKSFKVLRTNA